jgi:CubicO group peptidase (beta-lactamase class C family)
MIDLLAHRSGLDRSDVTFLYAPFTQAEMFELAYRAKPAAKFREKFLYSNTMYALAGAAVGRAYGTTYERFISERLFKALGMRSSSATLAEFLSSANRAAGYAGSAGAHTPEKPADLAAVAGAGSLNSTARDMAAWLRFLNAGGRLDGALEISPAAYARVFEVHFRHDENSGYGLGFEVQTRSGVLVASHGGNLPGYSAHVVHVPARALSFALLTNLSAAPLTAAADALFWDTVVKPELPAAAAPPTTPAPAPPPAASAAPISPDLLIGTYFASAVGAFEVKKSDGGLVAIFPGQPHYQLKAAGTNVYDLTGLDGFSLAFAESDAMPGRIAVLLRQPPKHPNGNVDYLKKDEVWLARAKAKYGGPDVDLIGHYHTADRSLRAEIVPYRQGLALILTMIPPLVLVQFGGDRYRMEDQPETFRLTVKRSGSRVLGFSYEQPNFNAELITEVSTAAADTGPAARGILDRAVAAAGGAEALNRIATRASIGRASAVTLGIEGRVEDLIVPGKRAELLELGAFGKFVLKIRVLTNERQSLTLVHGGQPAAATGKALEAARFFAVPHPLYRWQDRFASVALTGEAAIDGEQAFVVELTPRGLAPSRLFISAQSLMIVREETPNYVGDALQPAASTTDYADYRAVNGVRLPFAAAVTVPNWGRIAVTYESVALDTAIDPKVFE